MGKLSHKAAGSIDWFNEYLGFGKSNCTGGGLSGCINAIGMAGTAIAADIASEGAAAEGNAAREASQLHHIATDKSIVSGLTREFEKIFAKAGKDLQWKENLMDLPGHSGRHAAAYHEYVLEKLTKATKGLAGKDAEKALRSALRSLQREILKHPEILRGKGI